jgi:hypothetical protein
MAEKNVAEKQFQNVKAARFDPGLPEGLFSDQKSRFW